MKALLTTLTSSPVSRAAVAVLGLLLASCDNQATGTPPVATKPTPGHEREVLSVPAQKALALAETELAKVALWKGSDLYVLGFRAADLETADIKEFEDQFQALHWITFTHGPDGDRAGAPQKQQLAALDGMMSSMMPSPGNNNSGTNTLAGYQVAWKKAGIFPRVLYRVGLSHFTGITHAISEEPLTVADQRNGLQWKGRVQFKYSAAQSCTLVGDIGDDAVPDSERKWDEWIAPPAGGAGIFTVSLTLKGDQWQSTNFPAITSLDVYEKASVVEVSIATPVKSFLGTMIPDPAKRATVKLLKSEAPLTTGRYYAKPRLNTLPNAGK